MQDARALKLSKMKRKSTLRIPPDQDSHELKVARVNYQVHMFLQYDKPDCPIPPSIMDGQCVLVRHTQTALPRSLNARIPQLHFVVEAEEQTDSRGISDSGDDK